MAGKISLGVLVSGNGSNLEAIIANSRAGKIDADVSVVISNNEDAFALTRASRANIPAVVHLRKKYPTREAFELAIVETLKSYDVDLVCLAGFMRILSPVILNGFPRRIINIHPALLPSFPGLHAQRQALDYGVKVSGCTVHFVDEGTDTGPIIIQRAVPVEEDDTEETLSARILKEEHKTYSEAIQLIAKGRLEIRGRSVIVKSY